MKAKIWNKRGFIDLNKIFNKKRIYTNKEYFLDSKICVEWSIELFKILKDSGFKIINSMSYNFKPFGYTHIWLLMESHFAIRTFPENNKLYYELSSCNKKYFKIFNKKFKYFLKIKKEEYLIRIGNIFF